MKPKILYLNDDTIYMRTGRVIPPEWRNGNELLKQFNPWLYDPDSAQVQSTTKTYNNIANPEIEKV